SSILTVMLRLSKKSGLYPQCLSVRNVKKLGKYPVAHGGFGDVWKGIIGESNEPVCVKTVKIYLQSDKEKLCRAYMQESIVWRQLKHPNVLPFLGIYYLENDQQLCLISPWMENGNLVQYVKSTPRTDIEHYTLVYDVTNGLRYLHEREFVHGDLKGVNVLITHSKRACIGDFGLSRVIETHGLNLTTSTTRPVGTSRWLAPELLTGNRTSKESDIYAYGCVCYEIFTGLHPFPNLPTDGAVVLHVVQGKHSSRPEDISELNDSMWALMESCWNMDPSARPS
ncbi:kinase-like protein, partial [Marasmius fiardii PR-910]